MEKIYGYKEKDIIGLAKFLEENRGRPLSKIFESFAEKAGKAKGTIRNMYYALAKYSAKDKDFCEKHLGGKPLYVSKIVEFDPSEEKELIKKVLLGKKEGRSARSVITELAGGDIKKALRYQNKYRNAVKNNVRLVSEVIAEMRTGDKADFVMPKKNVQSDVSDVQFRRLKTEIDNLVNRISGKLRRENEYLKSRVASLELENIRLSNLLYGNNKAIDAIKFIGRRSDKNVLN